MKTEKTLSDNKKTDMTPLLDGISLPMDLRKLSVDQLPQVCAELRERIIHTLSTNPGHFAPIEDAK